MNEISTFVGLPMSDIRGLWQQVRKEAGLLDVRHEMLASLITTRQQHKQARVHECRLIRAIWKYDSYCRLLHASHQLNQTGG